MGKRHFKGYYNTYNFKQQKILRFPSLDLHQLSKNSNQETEAYNNHLAFSQTLLADQYKCTKFAEHNLINWFADDPPGFETIATNT